MEQSSSLTAWIRQEQSREEKIKEKSREKRKEKSREKREETRREKRKKRRVERIDGTTIGIIQHHPCEGAWILSSIP
jgi:outer membrane biosynthesis protein TonB